MATLQFTGPPIRRVSNIRSSQPARCPFCGTSCFVKIWADDPDGDGEGQDANFPNFPLALRRVSRIIDEVTEALEDDFLEDRGLAIARAAEDDVTGEEVSHD